MASILKLGAYRQVYCNGLVLSPFIEEVEEQSGTTYEVVIGMGQNESDGIPWETSAAIINAEKLIMRGVYKSEVHDSILAPLRAGNSLIWTVMPFGGLLGALAYGYQAGGPEFSIKGASKGVSRFESEGTSQVGLDMMTLIQPYATQNASGSSDPVTVQTGNAPNAVMHIQMIETDGSFTVKAQHKANIGDSWVDLLTKAITSTTPNAYRVTAATAVQKYQRATWTFGTASYAKFLVALSSGTTITLNIGRGKAMGFGLYTYGKEHIIS